MTRSAMTIVFYVSGHGFGHATRDVEILAAIRARHAGARLIVRTEAPAWLFARAGVEVQPARVDTGVVQLDSLRIDERATARDAAAFYATFDRRTDEEAAQLTALGAALVVADIPPLAFAAAARAGVPSIAVGNFTWDWIYRNLPAFEALAPEVVATAASAYALAALALRLPLNGGFDATRSILDIPFVARKSARDPQSTRRMLEIQGGRPLVLASFGAYGLALPLDDLRRSAAFTLMTLDGTPDGLEYQDIVAAADVVVSKPGYGIVSDCVANGTALLYTSRGRFAEYDVFIREMPRYLRCRFIPQADLVAGRWDGAVLELLSEQAPASSVRIDGAAVAAERILELIS
jgi:L-arabinokinase